MKAKTLGRNLKRTLNTIGKGYTLVMRKYRITHRMWLPNDEVRYATRSGSVMFVQDGEHKQITFKPGYTGYRSLLGIK